MNKIDLENTLKYESTFLPLTDLHPVHQISVYYDRETTFRRIRCFNKAGEELEFLKGDLLEDVVKEVDYHLFHKEEDVS